MGNDPFVKNERVPHQRASSGRRQEPRDQFT